MPGLSRYTVISEHSYAAPDGNQVRLVYGTRRSKVVPVQDWVVDALRRDDLGSLTEASLRALRDLEIVVDAPDNELHEIAQRNSAATAETADLHVALLPTSYCNMGCTYCGQEHTAGRLDSSHRDRIRERVTAMMQAPGARSMRLDWFGGEPLAGLATITDLSQDFIRVADDQGVDYRSLIVTNGSLLTRGTLRRLAAARVTHLEVTIDGPPAIHDSHRPLKKPGDGSFWKIVKALQLVITEGEFESMGIRIRSNVDSRNSAHMDEYFQLMADLGFAHPRVEFVAPVHSWGTDITEHEIAAREFGIAEARWLRVMRDLGLRFGLLPTEPAQVICPAVTRAGEIISSTGNVFSCSEHPLVPRAERTEVLIPLEALMRRGPATLRPAGQFDDWNLRVAQGKQACSTCPLFATCGGACPKAWTEGNPPCPSYKFNIQERFDLIAERHGLVPA